jgi:hypothetical protein
MKGRFTHKGRIPALTLVAVLAVVGVGYAAIPSAGGVIHSCYNASSSPSGQLRVIDTEAGAKCSRNEKALDFNQQGSKGDPGPAGPKGDQGPAGAAGGVSGYEIVNDEIESGEFDDGLRHSVDCPAGKRVIGGGAAVRNSGYDVALVESLPKSASDGWYANDGWTAVVERVDGTRTGSFSLQVTAICATVAE